MPDSIEESQKAQLPKIRPHGLAFHVARKALRLFTPDEE
jgi:hypothetical protein